MKTLKINNFTTKIVLGSIGFGYFIFFSGLDIPLFLRGYVTILPIQILAVSYFLYRYFKGNLN